jgi:hypothetical protein
MFHERDSQRVRLTPEIRYWLLGLAGHSRGTLEVLQGYSRGTLDCPERDALTGVLGKPGKLRRYLAAAPLGGAHFALPVL